MQSIQMTDVIRNGIRSVLMSARSRMCVVDRLRILGVFFALRIICLVPFLMQMTYVFVLQGCDIVGVFFVFVPIYFARRIVP
jgi:hypothetical protein